MRKIPNRPKYDTPPDGYKRQTAYVKKDTFAKFLEIAKVNKESLKEALEKAIKWYIGHGH